MVTFGMKHWIAGLVISLPLLVQASAVEQFKNFAANTKAAKGEFTQQQVKMVDGKAKISKTASGNFSFLRPGKFIWTYTRPYEQSLQADGEKLYIYDKDLNQVTIKPLDAAIGASPAAILFGNADLEKNFSLKDAGVKQGLEWLEAIAKSKDSQFDRISIGMKDGLPVALEIRDGFGQISVLSITGFEKNPVFKPDYFKFSIPAGADVFRP